MRHLTEEIVIILLWLSIWEIFNILFDYFKISKLQVIQLESHSYQLIFYLGLLVLMVYIYQEYYSIKQNKNY